MGYRLDLANRAGLFRNYAEWHEDGNIADPMHRNMIFRISGLINAIEKINMLKEECISQYFLFHDDLSSTRNIIHFQSPTLFDLFTSISESLTQLRIMQNILLPLIGKKLSCSLPNSMNDFCKKRSGCWSKKVGGEIETCIRNYWITDGALVKSYRDIDQHFDLLFRNAWIYKTEDNHNLTVYLPDNPEAKSRNKFKFDEQINAMDFINKSFFSIHAVVNDISKLLGYCSERVFDYNIIFEDGREESLCILFDPNRNIMCGQETFYKDEKMHGINHLRETDLAKFSFIKTVQHFNDKFSLLKFYNEVDEAPCIE